MERVFGVQPIMDKHGHIQIWFIIILQLHI